ncbi:MAG: hypothetical protein RQ763_11370, partial [Sulfurimonas sp.]|uniref:hypothetical protein n=1 Tax=Sulfurimonas sp. TaxID=2022749 RepID=UPI0028CC834E
MSIFYKVIIFFLITFSLMFFVSIEINKLTKDTIETLLRDKYIHVSGELFKYMSNSDQKSLDERLKELKFEIIEDKKSYIEKSHVLHEYNTEFSSVKILKDKESRYLLYMKYLDDEILVIDLSQDNNFEKKEFLNYMIVADIFILILLCLIILKMVYP